MSWGLKRQGTDRLAVRDACKRALKAAAPSIGAEVAAGVYAAIDAALSCYPPGPFAVEVTAYGDTGPHGGTFHLTIYGWLPAEATPATPAP